MVEVTEKKGCLGQESWSFGFPYKPKELILGLQHLFAFFGATILIPLIVGMDPSTALTTAGIGTLVFHYLTKLKVPVFLGSSAGFISGIVSTVLRYGPLEGPQHAQGGIMIAAVVSFLLSFVIYFLGVERVRFLFPPVVTGTVIIVIGVSLGYLAVNDFFAFLNQPGEVNQFYYIHQWAAILIAVFTLGVVLFCMAYLKNFLSMIPILMGMVVGYILCLLLRACTLPTVDFQPIVDGKWINLPYGHYYLKNSNPVFGGIFMLPKFDVVSIVSIAPLALITFMEHIGDITAISRIVGVDFFADPGLHRTMAADACGSFVAGFFGGPEITTYSENTGVLATTKVFDPRILRLSALYAISFGFLGKFSGIIYSIPAPVKGGVSIVLFGMIASCGVSSLIESRVDLSKTRNLIIVSLMLSVGLGLNTATYANGGTGGVNIWFGKTSITLSGLFLCMVAGVVANLILPATSAADTRQKEQEEEREKMRNSKELNEQGQIMEVVPSTGSVSPVVANEDSPVSVGKVSTPTGGETPSPSNRGTPTGSTDQVGGSANEVTPVSVKAGPETNSEMEVEMEVETEVE